MLVSGKGLLPGNTFLAATDSALNDPQKRAALQDYLQRLAGAERWAYANLDSYGKTLGEIIRFPAEIARAQFANRQSQWQPLAEETVAQQQATADFYLANGLIRTRLDVKPTFDRRFSVPAAEVTIVPCTETGRVTPWMVRSPATVTIWVPTVARSSPAAAFSMPLKVALGKVALSM